MQPTNPILGGQPGGGIGGVPPALNQQTPQSASFTPGMLPQPIPQPQLQPMAPLGHLEAAMKRRGMQPLPQQNPQQQAAQSMMPPQAPGVPVQPGANMPPTESSLLIKALQEMAKPLQERIGMLTKKEQQLNDHIADVRKEYTALNGVMKNDMKAHGEGTELPKKDSSMMRLGTIL